MPTAIGDSLGEWMVRRHSRAELAHGAGEHFEVTVLGEVEADAEVGLAVRHRGLNFVAGSIERQVQLYPGIGEAELLHRSRYELGGKAAPHRCRDLAASQALQLLDLALRALQFL